MRTITIGTRTIDSDEFMSISRKLTSLVLRSQVALHTDAKSLLRVLRLARRLKREGLIGPDATPGDSIAIGKQEPGAARLFTLTVLVNHKAAWSHYSDLARTTSRTAAWRSMRKEIQFWESELRALLPKTELRAAARVVRQAMVGLEKRGRLS